MNPLAMRTPILFKSVFTSAKASTMRRWLFLIVIGASGLSLLPASRAVYPSPDGGYDNDNTAEGEDALFYLTSGVGNAAVGFRALFLDQTGQYNTAIGAGALYNNTTASNNTAVGFEALESNSGSENTAVGSTALVFNASGQSNTATGFESLYSNKDGSGNVANGWQALYSNTSGESNTATGATALNENTTGSYNTANGTNALRYNTTGKYNTATGGNAMVFGNGQNNSAYGFESLQNNATGNNNTAIGFDALFNNNSGSNNLALGYQAGLNFTTGSNNIVIGAGVLGGSGDANKIRIGKQGTQTATYIAGISGKTVASASAVAVFVDSTGKLGTVKSSARFKDNIKPMDKASEALLKLEPVTFRYKKELDPDGVTQFGLIAEQVEKVNPDLIVRDEDGKVSTVHYEAVNAMLLNEFLKEYRTVQELKATVAKQQQTITQQQTDFERRLSQQQKQIQSLTAGLQKVNSKIELESASQPLATNH
jgi:hypothetical protein